MLTVTSFKETAMTNPTPEQALKIIKSTLKSYELLEYEPEYILHLNESNVADLRLRQLSKSMRNFDNLNDAVAVLKKFKDRYGYSAAAEQLANSTPADRIQQAIQVAGLTAGRKIDRVIDNLLVIVADVKEVQS